MPLQVILPFLSLFLLCDVNASAASNCKEKYVVTDLRCFINDTTNKPNTPNAKAKRLQEKILGTWTDGNAGNATFEIKPASIYYFEHGTSYKYSLKGNIITIRYPDYVFRGKVTLERRVMTISSDEFGVSRYRRHE